jgi:hypothetical protein
MAGFVEGVDRGQITLFPALLDDYVAEDNPVRAVDVFVDGLDLDKLGFVGIQPIDRGRPSYHPGMMLKLYIYGPQSGAVEPAPGARVPAQYRDDLADRASGAGLQDDRGFPKGQRQGHP